MANTPDNSGLATFFTQLLGGTTSSAGSAGTAGAVASANPWIMGAAAIPSLINYFRGVGMERKGEALARSNIRPAMNITPYYDLLQLFQKQAQYGLDPSSMAWQLQNTNQGLTSSINATLQGGGDPNMIAGLFGGYANNVGQIASMDSQLRWQKVNAEADAANQLAQAKQAKWEWEKADPFLDTARYASDLMGGGITTQTNATDAMTALALNAATANYKQGKTNNTVTPTAPDQVTIGPPPTGYSNKDVDKLFHDQELPPTPTTAELGRDITPIPPTNPYDMNAIINPGANQPKPLTVPPNTFANSTWAPGGMTSPLSKAMAAAINKIPAGNQQMNWISNLIKNSMGIPYSNFNTQRQYMEAVSGPLRAALNEIDTSNSTKLDQSWIQLSDMLNANAGKAWDYYVH